MNRPISARAVHSCVPSWRDLACGWATGYRDRARATVCARCPVAAECLTTAIAGSEEGVWAATSQRERRSMRRAARCAPMSAPLAGNQLRSWCSRHKAWSCQGGGRKASNSSSMVTRPESTVGARSWWSNTTAIVARTVSPITLLVRRGTAIGSHPLLNVDGMRPGSRPPTLSNADSDASTRPTVQPR